LTYLLDTNTCIRYLNGRAPSVRQRLASVAASEVAVCSVVKAELFFGAMRSRDPQKTLARQQAFLAPYDSLPFDDRAAMECGRIRAELAAAGTPIGSNDVLIAAIALVNGLTLVTHNTGEFGRVNGLFIEDWEMPTP
jgi:tRNA(fMet)-specific endonuclease VapC